MEDGEKSKIIDLSQAVEAKRDEQRVAELVMQAVGNYLTFRAASRRENAVNDSLASQTVETYQAAAQKATAFYESLDPSSQQAVIKRLSKLNAEERQAAGNLFPWFPLFDAKQPQKRTA